ncbi:MAG: Peptide chain release factor 1 [Acidimicrobiales bacterium]|nr:MAG: peptide chain release factor 1 [Actinomycetota bacterium]MBV6508880.1 Peptide chain release factor 1 [Acidimicrobiales bacterium]RIK05017.1 MAG: peptide chain release factor 1 [Acidobacteriota bacterium]
MLQRLAEIEIEFRDVEARLADPALLQNQEHYVDLTRRHRELASIVDRYHQLLKAIDDRDTAREMIAEVSGEEKEMLREELATADATISGLEDELKVLLLPRDPNDDKNVIVEIRGAEGGEEANLFARDLFEMYKAYAARMGWQFEFLGANPSDMGGFSEVTFLLVGKGIWSRMKHEAGPHRVQRVPVTESQGRIHTSSATVSVLPEAQQVDVTIDPGDLVVDTYRSSGPGGQSVNTTDSAVRVTHKPTGIVVAMQDEKSQIQNRAKAMQVLRSRVLKLEQERQAADRSESRREQIGGGGRSEKVRTYNFKENRVSDHRIGLTVYNLDRVLAGELDEVSDALVQDERARQLRGS